MARLAVHPQGRRDLISEVEFAVGACAADPDHEGSAERLPAEDFNVGIEVDLLGGEVPQ